MKEPIRVLHVDDEPDLADLVASFLESENDRFVVETASNVEAGLDRVDSESYDCVVSDYDMPGLNGIEFLERVRERDERLPFILFTGKGSEEVASRAISKGVTDYLQKGTGTDQYELLANRIGNSVAQYRAEHELERREEKLRQLRAKMQELSYTRTVEETIEHAVAAADEIIEAPLSGIHLLNEAETALEPAGVVDSAAEAFDEEPRYERDAPPGTRAALAWTAFRGEGPVAIDHLSVSDRLQEETPTESVILHPLGDRGLFVVSAPDPGAFDETDVLLVQILSNDLEVALDRVEREQTLRTRQQRLERLHEATRELVNATSSEEIAELVVDAAGEILGFTKTVVRLYDPNAGGLVPVATSDAVSGIVPERDVYTPEEGSVNWEAYETGEVRIYDDVSTVENAVDSDTALASLMILPLGEFGTLSVGETATAAFDDADEYFARVLATAAETALEAKGRER